MDLANTMAGLEREKRWGEAAAALAFNLIPVVGVLFWHWSLFGLVFLYWFENVAIGARTLLCMVASGARQGPLALIGALFSGAFFSVHYGFFCLIHGVFVVYLFGAGLPFPDGTFWLGLWHAALAHAGDISFGLISIAFWQGVQFVLFILRGEAKTARPSELMSAPYPRIIVLHLAVIAGGFLITALGRPVWGLVVLVLFKTIYEVAPRMANTAPAKPLSIQFGDRSWTPGRNAPQG